MVRPGWIAVGIVASALVGGAGGDVPTASAEIRLDRDFLAAILAKVPPCPFEKAGQYRGKVDGFRIEAIDPKARRVRVSCAISGEFDERAVVAGLSGTGGKSGQVPMNPAAARWRKFRFDVRVAVNVEPGPGGAPRLKLDVDEVRRRELEGSVGTLAKVMGRASTAPSPRSPTRRPTGSTTASTPRSRAGPGRSGTTDSSARSTTSRPISSPGSTRPAIDPRGRRPRLPLAPRRHGPALPMGQPEARRPFLHDEPLRARPARLPGRGGRLPRPRPSRARRDGSPAMARQE